VVCVQGDLNYRVEMGNDEHDADWHAVISLVGRRAWDRLATGDQLQLSQVYPDPLV
jgi:hypothetical protein